MQLLPEVSLTQARIEHIQGLVRQIENHLPFLVRLTMDERKRIYRKGEKQLEYIRKTLNYARQMPHLVPDYVDVGRMDHDLYIGEQLGDLMQRVGELKREIEDTRSLFYAQAFDAARTIYTSFRNASGNGMHQASEAVGELRSYFPRTGKNLKNRD